MEARRPISYNPAKGSRGALSALPVGFGAKHQPIFIVVHFELHRRPLVRMI